MVETSFETDLSCEKVNRITQGTDGIFLFLNLPFVIPNHFLY